MAPSTKGGPSPELMKRIKQGLKLVKRNRVQLSSMAWNAVLVLWLGGSHEG